jgi:hypothetical protein
MTPQTKGARKLVRDARARILISVDTRFSFAAAISINGPIDAGALR